MFELVVFNSLPRNIFKWQIYNGKWVNYEWDFNDKKIVVKGKEDVQNMKPGILYYPVDPQFPVVDFVFVKETQTAQK